MVIRKRFSVFQTAESLLQRVCDLLREEFAFYINIIPETVGNYKDI